MSGPAAIVARVVIATLQGAGVIYVALVAWLASSWVVDDSWAARATDADWWLLAGKRSLQGLVMALVVGLLLLAINRAMVYWRIESQSARPLRTALIGALVILVASAAGAIQFAIQRPWF